jgi:hypothetical protein
MKKFKKGGKVRVISAGWGVSELDLGKTTTITSAEGAYSTYKFDTTGFEYTNYQGSLGADARSFELIEEPKQEKQMNKIIPGSPADELGFVIGGKYTPKDDERGDFGAVYTFEDDDNTSCPQFACEDGGWCYRRLNRLKPYVAQEVVAEVAKPMKMSYTVVTTDEETHIKFNKVLSATEIADIMAAVYN